VTGEQHRRRVPDTPGAELMERRVHVNDVPEHDEIDNEAERAYGWHSSCIYKSHLAATYASAETEANGHQHRTARQRTGCCLLPVWNRVDSHLGPSADSICSRISRLKSPATPKT
jgi:hypothetical protein